MNSLINGYKDLTKVFFNEFEQKNGDLPKFKDIMERFVEINHAFVNDTLFNEIIPIVYNIEFCERKIEQDKIKPDGTDAGKEAERPVGP